MEGPETKGQCTAAEVPSQKVPPTQNFEKALRGAACCPDMTATMLAASQDDNNVALLKKLPKMPERDRHQGTASSGEKHPKSIVDPNIPSIAEATADVMSTAASSPLDGPR